MSKDRMKLLRKLPVGVSIDKTDKGWVFTYLSDSIITTVIDVNFFDGVKKFLTLQAYEAREGG